MAPRELIVDLFAGGGGASTAILNATGRHPDVAVNHNPAAIGVHEANHPNTRHFTCDINEVDPMDACTIDGVVHPVGLLWASPDCTHFSKARGGKPVEKRIRSLADVVVIWARWVRPRLIHLENVEEFQDWGPVLENGQPCPESKGLDFRRWVRDLEDLGYVVEWRELVAADYGAPTTRKRLFLIARCDGEPIRWPAPTHASRASIAKGDPKALGRRPWRAAAEIIDWTLPVPSIFGRKRPLKPKTQARIAKGLKRFVIEAAQPFIVPVTNGTWGGDRVRTTDQPLRTITTSRGGEYALGAPSIVPLTHAGSDDRVYDPADPMRTVTGANRGELAMATALLRTDFVNTRAGCVYDPATDPLPTILSQPGLGALAATLVAQYGEREGQEPRARDVAEPYATVVPNGNGGKLATVYLEQANGRDVGADAASPLRTATDRAHQGVVAAHLTRQFGSTVSGRPADEPTPTVMGDGHGGKTGVVAASLTTYYGGPGGDQRGSAASEPVRTIPTENRHGVVAAAMVQHNAGQVGREASEPVTTLTHRGTQQQVMTACVDKYYGSGVAADVAEPLDTATAKARFGLAAAYLEQANTGMVGRPPSQPVSTIVGKGCTQRLIEVGMVPANDHHGASSRAQVIDFLWSHFGPPDEDEWADPTATPSARLKFGLVVLAGTVWQITDVGMRMLTPRELFSAQGFPPSYIIDRTANGEPVTKTAQTSMAGNSVSPPPAEATLRANLTWMDLPERLAA